MNKKTISYPEEIEEQIESDIEAGLVENRSEWFREAAHAFITLKRLGAANLISARDEKGIDPTHFEEHVERQVYEQFVPGGNDA